MSYVFYDTKCGFCSNIIDPIRKRRNLSNVNFFDISQMDEILTFKEKKAIQGVDSIIVIDESNIWKYSNAIIKLFILTGGNYKVMGCCLSLIPRPLRDVTYRFVARNRYGFFGRLACRKLD